MSMWPGLEVWTPQWGILSTWPPSGKCSGDPEEAWPSRATLSSPFPTAPGWRRSGGQPVLIQLLDVTSQPRSEPMD